MVHIPDKTPPAYAHPARLILILALSPAIGLGIGRFAYSLVLPDMRDSLGWSYSAAGFMNTMNAIGYLAGALGAASFVRRAGLFAAAWIGAVICVISLAMCAATGNFTVLSLARFLAGAGAAISFVGGGALGATIAQSQPARASLLLSLFYTGPALGIVLSGLIAPFLLQALGPGSWWTVWAVLAAISALMTAVLMLNPIASAPLPAHASAIRIPLTPVLAYLVGYFCFGAGYIAYMTFMIAYVRDAGGSPLAQSAFWCLIGSGAFASPWVWRRLMARGASGMSTGILIGITMVGAVLPLLRHSPLMLVASALVFGNAFFAVVTSTTAFVRFNYPPDAWPKAIAVMTIAFSLGQTLGPIVTGAISDAMGSLGTALNISALTLAIGAIASAFQRKLPQPA
ncbi:YbfB/YjiJ family MFS transporter [Bradyrhizobium prioriisuperbiae]|uniref:YbfB/YjiJ family MFS transporter n=1 Tax=Bradyrhizobium prioriisuperbiae TaxID=2854389 RepID=UPI0028ED51E9|nr:YbfB/YjiJ family MFS transporter [Bradyrhizobium prioritasuperba]